MTIKILLHSILKSVLLPYIWPTTGTDRVSKISDSLCKKVIGTFIRKIVCSLQEMLTFYNQTCTSLSPGQLS